MSTWFTRYRQHWIKLTVENIGHIRRSHLVDYFGISIPQASIDLRHFQEAHPGWLEYDKARKMYIKTERWVI